MKYHRVVSNPAARDLWCLDAPEDPKGGEVDPREFCVCQRWMVSMSLTANTRAGMPARFSLNDFDYPVAEESVATRIQSLDPRLQLVPLEVRGRIEAYRIINVLRRVACIDEEASEFDRFAMTGSRPDLAGQYKTFYRLRLNPAVVPEAAHIFRVSGYEVALVVSDTMKKLLIEAGGDDGVSFAPVT